VRAILLAMDKTVLSEVHRFWFGPLSGPTDYPKDKAVIWFRQSDQTDAFIANQFGRWISPAASMEWEPHALTREERTGLVVLLDQFPRNVFRRSPESFAYDGRARALADALIADGVDRYYLIERSFLFLPLEHSESKTDQARSVALFEALVGAAPQDQKNIYEEMLKFAVKHRQLIDTFGRFPHRNAILGRASTAQELTFMVEHGRGY
jgi:uncharacterized protein (DUF924 family)